MKPVGKRLLFSFPSDSIYFFLSTTKASYPSMRLFFCKILRIAEESSLIVPESLDSNKEKAGTVSIVRASSRTAL